MSSKVEQLPDDPVLLKALLVQYQNKEHRFESQIKKLTQQVHDLFEALRLERHSHCGTKSEKAPGQGELFDEVESGRNEESIESSDNDPSEQGTDKLMLLSDNCE